MKNLFFLMLFSTSSLACVPGILLEANLKYFPTPKFSSSVNVSEFEGTVVAVVTTEGYKVSQFEIIEVSPSDLPIEPIANSLKKAVFAQSLNREKVKFYFDIVIPEKLEVEASIELPPID